MTQRLVYAHPLLHPSMQALDEQAYGAAEAPISVLLLGETDTGKEVLAQAIHRRSPRAQVDGSATLYSLQ